MTFGTAGEPLCVWCRRHPVVHEWRPFCSERCRQQDLARWADGSYRVPGQPVEDAGPDDESRDRHER
ncbi:MAG: DNA gyrase inhibitor YacG [Vicinamibacterales bacterium]